MTDLSLLLFIVEVFWLCGQENVMILFFRRLQILFTIYVSFSWNYLNETEAEPGQHRILRKLRDFNGVFSYI